MDIVKKMKSDLNIWYLDDGTIAGNVQTVMEDYGEILKALESHGLAVNPTKCELHLALYTRVPRLPESSVQTEASLHLGPWNFDASRCTRTLLASNRLCKDTPSIKDQSESNRLC